MALHRHKYYKYIYKKTSWLSYSPASGSGNPWAGYLPTCGNGHNSCLKRTDEYEHNEWNNFYILDHSEEAYSSVEDDTDPEHTHQLYVFKLGEKGTGVGCSIFKDGTGICDSGHPYCKVYGYGVREYHNRYHGVIETDQPTWNGGDHRHRFSGDSPTADYRGIIGFQTCPSGHTNCQCLVSDIVSYISDTQYSIYTDYDEEASSPSLPSVSTNPATNISIRGAILNGELTDDGGETCKCGFEWGETDAYGNITATENKDYGETFAKSIAGLIPNTTYHFRAFAINSAGTAYGEDKYFTTLASPEDGLGTKDIVTLEALRNIEMMALGRLYIDEEGKAKYESRFHRSI